MAHTDALRAMGCDYSSLLDGGVDVVVGAAALQFRQTATFDDQLVVRVSVQPPGTSLSSEFTVVRGTQTIAECAVTHVCVDATTYEKTPWPQWLRKRLPHPQPPH